LNDHGIWSREPAEWRCSRYRGRNPTDDSTGTTTDCNVSPGIYASSSRNIFCTHGDLSSAAQWADGSSAWSNSGCPAISYSVSTGPDSSAESEDSQESVDSVTDSQKRREILSRRPSYRKILNDLSSDAPGVPRIEEEKSEEETAAPAIATVTVPTPIYQTSSGQYIAITQGGAIQLSNNGTDGVQGLQTLTMTNAAATQPGTTILQYAQTTDGQQILVPSNQVVVQAASGDVQTYQIRTAPTSTIAPGVVMASSPALPTQPAEEAARKREVRLMKNREAARECRRKKKEYVKCLENRVAVLENQNKTLIEELKALKDLYCHKSD
uniref:cAMP responsive element binding protein 1 n=1 Tax=Taeniopygia guttata TaxID=59729 RepID=A0A674GG60_TAEGU